MINLIWLRRMCVGRAESKPARFLAIVIGLSISYIIGSCLGLFILGTPIQELVNNFQKNIFISFFAYFIWVVGSFGFSLICGEISGVFYIFFGKQWLYYTSITLMFLKSFLVVLSIQLMTT